MRYVTSLGIILLVLLLSVGFSLSVGASSLGNTKYAAYTLSIVSPTFAKSFVFNESITPTSNPNLSILTLALMGSGWNLTYSESVNSSMSFFPYLPSIQNKSLSYSSANYSFGFTLIEEGSASITFDGNTYKGTLYAFSGHAVTRTGAYSVTGNLTVFPSSLLYSFQASLNDTATVQAELVSTNLPLAQSDPQASYTMIGLAAGVGAVSVAIVGLGIPFIGRRKRSGGVDTTPKAKDYWVD
jgi:hypothetical protein